MLAIGVVAATRSVGPVPPLGTLLEPAGGIWAMGRAAAVPAERTVRSIQFTDDVRAVIDDRGVPHVYASNELDAYRALGFLVARDRLFQLEVQTRAAAGTLTELVGSRALKSDRDARRLGFARLIERNMREADTTSPAFQSVKAYAEGVNTWIDAMRPADLPLEYRLLGRRPTRWVPANTYLLLARMALTLGYNDASLIKAKAASRVGRAAAEALFPLNAPSGQYQLTLTRTIYTSFLQALSVITTPRIGRVEDFMRDLQAKVDEKLETPPNNRTIESPI